MGYGWLTKPRVTASPSPSEGGDVPDGIQNAGCWGEGGREKSDLKDVCLFLMGKDLEFKEYALSHLTRLLVNPQKQYLWTLTSLPNKESVLHGTADTHLSVAKRGTTKKRDITPMNKNKTSTETQFMTFHNLFVSIINRKTQKKGTLKTSVPFVIPTGFKPVTS